MSRAEGGALAGQSHRAGKADDTRVRGCRVASHVLLLSLPGGERCPVCLEGPGDVPWRLSSGETFHLHLGSRALFWGFILTLGGGHRPGDTPALVFTPASPAVGYSYFLSPLFISLTVRPRSEADPALGLWTVALGGFALRAGSLPGWCCFQSSVSVTEECACLKPLLAFLKKSCSRISAFPGRRGAGNEIKGQHPVYLPTRALRRLLLFGRRGGIFLAKGHL